MCGESAHETLSCDEAEVRYARFYKTKKAITPYVQHMRDCIECLMTPLRTREAPLQSFADLSGRMVRVTRKAVASNASSLTAGIALRAVET